MITPRHTYILTWDLDNDMYPIHDRQKDMRRFHFLKRRSDYRYSLLSMNNPDFAGIFYGSLNNHYLAQRGDRYFSLLFSRQEGFKNRIVDSGFFKTDPYLGLAWKGDNSGAMTVQLDADVVLNPELELPLLTEECLELQFPDYDWSGSTTDFMLDERTALLLEEKWYNYLSVETQKMSERDFWCRSPKNVFTDQYEWQNEHGDYDMGRAMLYVRTLKMKLTSHF